MKPIRAIFLSLTWNSYLHRPKAKSSHRREMFEVVGPSRLMDSPEDGVDIRLVESQCVRRPFQNPHLPPKDAVCGMRLVQHSQAFTGVDEPCRLLPSELGDSLSSTYLRRVPSYMPHRTNFAVGGLASRASWADDSKLAMTTVRLSKAHGEARVVLVIESHVELIHTNPPLSEGGRCANHAVDAAQPPSAAVEEP